MIKRHEPSKYSRRMSCIGIPLDNFAGNNTLLGVQEAE